MAKLQRPFSLLLLAACCYSSSVLASMPTFFSADEARFDRYAACLAATEKLRRDRSFADDGNTDEYITDASKILKGLGSSIEEYNEIGREILGNSDLKQRVRPFSPIFCRANLSPFLFLTGHVSGIPLSARIEHHRGQEANRCNQ